MGPTQFARQCLAFFIDKIKLTHILQIRARETFSKFFCQFNGKSFQCLENSEENTTTLLHYEPTGWDLVDDGVNRMKEVLISAEKTLDYQSVGMYGRELLITLA